MRGCAADDDAHAQMRGGGDALTGRAQPRRSPRRGWQCVRGGAGHRKRQAVEGCVGTVVLNGRGSRHRGYGRQLCGNRGTRPQGPAGCNPKLAWSPLRPRAQGGGAYQRRSRVPAMPKLGQPTLQERGPVRRRAVSSPPADATRRRGPKHMRIRVRLRISCTWQSWQHWRCPCAGTTLGAFLTLATAARAIIGARTTNTTQAPKRRRGTGERGRGRERRVHGRGMGRRGREGEGVGRRALAVLALLALSCDGVDRARVLQRAALAPARLALA